MVSQVLFRSFGLQVLHKRVYCHWVKARECNGELGLCGLSRTSTSTAVWLHTTGLLIHRMQNTKKWGEFPQLCAVNAPNSTMVKTSTKQKGNKINTLCEWWSWNELQAQWYWPHKWLLLWTPALRVGLPVGCSQNLLGSSGLNSTAKPM